MEKEVHIEKIILDEMEHHEGAKVIKIKKGGCGCGEEGHKEHKHKDHKEHKHFKHHKHRKPRVIKVNVEKEVMKTKMFITKESLVEYVNEIGEEGHMVDIFKIEDGLYKVVVFKKNTEVEAEVK